MKQQEEDASSPCKAMTTTTTTIATRRFQVLVGSSATTCSTDEEKHHQQEKPTAEEAAAVETAPKAEPEAEADSAPPISSPSRARPPRMKVLSADDVVVLLHHRTTTTTTTTTAEEKDREGKEEEKKKNTTNSDATTATDNGHSAKTKEEKSEKANEANNQKQQRQQPATPIISTRRTPRFSVLDDATSAAAASDSGSRRRTTTRTRSTSTPIFPAKDLSQLRQQQQQQQQPSSYRNNDSDDDEDAVVASFDPMRQQSSSAVREHDNMHHQDKEGEDERAVVGNNCQIDKSQEEKKEEEEEEKEEEEEDLLSSSSNKSLSVSERAAWLASKPFYNKKKEELSTSTATVDGSSPSPSPSSSDGGSSAVADKAAWLASKPFYNNSPDKKKMNEAEESALSAQQPPEGTVSERKDWLQSTFNIKGSNSTSCASSNVVIAGLMNTSMKNGAISSVPVDPSAHNEKENQVSPSEQHHHQPIVPLSSSQTSPQASTAEGVHFSSIEKLAAWARQLEGKVAEKRDGLQSTTESEIQRQEKMNVTTKLNLQQQIEVPAGGSTRSSKADMGGGEPITEQEGDPVIMVSVAEESQPSADDVQPTMPSVPHSLKTLKEVLASDTNAVATPTASTMCSQDDDGESIMNAPAVPNLLEENALASTSLIAAKRRGRRRGRRRGKKRGKATAKERQALASSSTTTAIEGKNKEPSAPKISYAAAARLVPNPNPAAKEHAPVSAAAAPNKEVKPVESPAEMKAATITAAKAKQLPKKDIIVSTWKNEVKPLHHKKSSGEGKAVKKDKVVVVSDQDKATYERNQNLIKKGEEKRKQDRKLNDKGNVNASSKPNKANNASRTREELMKYLQMEQEDEEEEEDERGELEATKMDSETGGRNREELRQRKMGGRKEKNKGKQDNRRKPRKHETKSATTRGKAKSGKGSKLAATTDEIDEEILLYEARNRKPEIFYAQALFAIALPVSLWYFFSSGKL